MSWLMEMLGRPFSPDGFVPRRLCGLWPGWLVWEHIVGNALIWLAYLVMPLLILGVARRRAELARFQGVVWAFGGFIALCGLGHFLDMLAFFRPMYRLSGHVLIATGLASWGTAWALRRAWPAIEAMKSPEELERVIAARTEELIRALDELRRAEADRSRLATIVESSSDAIISRDLRGVITSWNAGAERIFGYTAAEAVGRPLLGLIPPDRRDEEELILASLRLGERVDHFDSIRVAKDGRPIHVSMSISPIKDGDGRVIGISKIARDIGQAKAAEEALRSSERIYRAIGESIPFGVWTCDPAGRNTYASESFLKLVGLTQAQCSEFGWGEVLHPDDADRTIEAWRECVRSEGTWDIEHRFRGADGSWHPILARGVAVRDDRGRIISWAGINLDLSRLKASDQALRASEEKFRLLAESIPQLAWMAGPDGYITWYNRRWYDYTGTTPEQMEGWGWQSVHDPDALPAVLERWGGSIANGEPFDMVFPLRGADGQFRKFLTRVLPSRDVDGRVLGWFGTNTDIDEQKRAEAALREDEERLRLLNEELEQRVRERTAELRQQVRLIDQAHDAILVRSKEGVISSWNRGAERLYGWTREEALGRVSQELLKTRFPGPMAEIEDAMARLGSWDGELIHERRDGARVVIASRWVADRDGSADEAVLEINSDITARKEAEAALRDSRDVAMAATRAKGDFLANMSHEIRTPMNGVIGLSDLLLDTELDETQRAYVADINTSAEALLAIINDILDLSKIEAGKMTLDVAPFDLRALLDEVTRLLTPRARQKGLRITGVVAPEVPGRLMGDATRIRQVLTNLAGNAVKFTDSGEVAIRAGVLSRAGSDATLRLEVRDTGIGIPLDQQESVFQSFTQVEGDSSRKHGGTGLGLTISRDLAELMGGRIGLVSEPGRGTTFWIEVTMAEAAPVAPAPAPAQPTKAPLPVSARILLVDDHVINRMVASHLLERMGCAVDVVGDGPGALEALGGATYDMVLMDLQMPGMDGYATTIELRRRERATGRRLPVIALTADAMAEDHDRCLLAGMDDRLTKPIRQDALREAILRWIPGPPRSIAEHATAPG